MTNAVDDATLGAMVKKAMRGIEKSSTHLERAALAGAAMILANFLHEHQLPSLVIDLSGIADGIKIQVTKNGH